VKKAWKIVNLREDAGDILSSTQIHFQKEIFDLNHKVFLDSLFQINTTTKTSFTTAAFAIALIIQLYLELAVPTSKAHLPAYKVMPFPHTYSIGITILRLATSDHNPFITYTNEQLASMTSAQVQETFLGEITRAYNSGELSNGSEDHEDDDGPTRSKMVAKMMRTMKSLSATRNFHES